MQNKTDQFVGFDPTQNQGSGCCGTLYWDFETQTWKQRSLEAPSGSDCSQVQAQLDQANETIADLLDKLNASEQRANELQAENTACETANNAANTEIEALRRTLRNRNNTITQLETRIAELEKQIDEQPTVCEIIAQHLDPVRRLNGEIIYYGIKNPPDCPDLNIGQNTGLGGDGITTIIEIEDEDEP